MSKPTTTHTMSKLSLQNKFRFKRIPKAIPGNGPPTATPSLGDDCSPCENMLLEEPEVTPGPQTSTHSKGNKSSQNLLQVDTPIIGGVQAAHSLPTNRRSHQTPVDQVTDLVGMVNPQMSSKPTTSFESVEGPSDLLTLPPP